MLLPRGGAGWRCLCRGWPALTGRRGEQALGRRGSSARAAALRRAQQAKAGRDAERVLRERQIEIALADWFEATARAERIGDEARRKAAAVIEAGGHAAAEPAGEAREAVRRLRELTGSNTEVAALCGLSVAAVRDLLTGPGGPPGLPPEPAPARPGAGVSSDDS
jgi:hypothetical protein